MKILKATRSLREDLIPCLQRSLTQENKLKLSFLVHCCKKVIKLQRCFFLFKRKGADEIGVCKNGKLSDHKKVFVFNMR